MDIAPLHQDRHQDLRDFLERCWIETYTDEIGADLAKALVEHTIKDDVGFLLPGDGEEAFACYDENRIVASIIRKVVSNHIYVWGFYVAPELQRHGLGTRFLCHVIDGINPDFPVEVSVLKASKGAMAFYKKLGFREIADEPYQLFENKTLPAMIMQAPVSTIFQNCRSSDDK
ncbi:GNAT family N-acetyltransferase [uncultured Cohaesibacter sp.]|uniref:GNAT family N-acetyltransferase n=1 Tax=uncultured Cohaesibacter sp. TaxID=1002546 RepID=UPI00292CD996|nr:GNAT family N-acetyltransferase [uncultured Cohaesibacter sp.]